MQILKKLLSKFFQIGYIPPVKFQFCGKFTFHWVGRPPSIFICMQKTNYDGKKIFVQILKHICPFFKIYFYKSSTELGSLYLFSLACKNKLRWHIFVGMHANNKYLIYQQISQTSHPWADRKNTRTMSILHKGQRQNKLAM